MTDFDNDLMSIQETRNLLSSAKKAQEIYKTFSQEKVDMIVKSVAFTAEEAATELAKMAWEETGFGNWQDKRLKNIFASKTVYESIKDLKTVGIINEDKENKFFEVAVPVGVIAALIPSTNPTSTVIYKVLIALKSGNGIILSPHPNAKNCILETARILIDASVKAGAPEGLIGCISEPSIESTNLLMKDSSLILATGGEAMVKAAYSSGTPALGVGPGNGPSFIDESADIKCAVKRIIDSKTFDNGVICASENSIIVEKSIRDKVLNELKKQGAYILNDEESTKLGNFMLRPNGTMNPQIVGKSIEALTEMVNMDIPSSAKILISEQTTVGRNNPYSREKLTPVLAFYTVDNVEDGIKRCTEILINEGKGHTLSLHCNDEKIIREFGLRIPVSRLLVNTPSALGGIGATTNLMPSLTLGCGAIGGSATSDNVGPMNLINIRKVALGVRELEDIKPTDMSSSEITEISEEYLELIINMVVEKLSALNR